MLKRRLILYLKDHVRLILIYFFTRFLSRASDKSLIL